MLCGTGSAPYSMSSPYRNARTFSPPQAMSLLRRNRFCNGPSAVNPFFCAVSTAGVMLLYGVSAGLPPDGVRKGRGRSNLIWRGCRACAKHHRAEMRPDPIHRPGGDAASGRGCHPARKPSNASPFAPQRTAERFFVRLSGVSPPRPKLGKAPRAASCPCCA